MAVGNATSGGSGTLRKDDYLLLANDTKDPTVLVARFVRDVAPKVYNEQVSKDGIPAVTVDIAFISGPRKGEVVGGETMIAQGMVRTLANQRPGQVTVCRVGKYKSYGSDKPSLDPASQPEMTAALAALDEAAAAGHTFTDADGDTVGDVWMHYEKLGGGQSADDDEPPF